jgi:hypothetical protein
MCCYIRIPRAHAHTREGQEGESQRGREIGRQMKAEGGRAKAERQGATPGMQGSREAGRRVFMHTIKHALS